MRAALLIDLDGTLIDIAPTPDAVVVPRSVVCPTGRKNGTANHAEHAKVGGALQGQDGVFDQ